MESDRDFGKRFSQYLKNHNGAMQFKIKLGSVTRKSLKLDRWNSVMERNENY